MEKIKISLKQQKFLDHNNIPLSKVFNAKNYKTKDWKKIMLENELWVAIEVTPCKLEGHTMRSSGGACIECNPDSLRFLKRYYSHGFVYLAGSLKEMVFKIGFSKNIENREISLNEQGYGNIYDWKILYYLETNNSGKLESEIHKSLYKYLSPRIFIKDGKENICREIFNCNYQRIKYTIENLVTSQNIKINNEWVNDDLIVNYD